jgi:uncharacterized membrane protein
LVKKPPAIPEEDRMSPPKPDAFMADLEEVRARLAVVERRIGLRPPAPARSPAPLAGPSIPPPSLPLRVAPPPVLPRPKRGWEELVGGRLLAWVGGVAVCVGLAFLLAVAVSRGWLGEGARVGLGAVLGTGLLGVGAWLQERRGAPLAGRVAAGTGIAGLFAALTVGAAGYGLIGVVPGLLVAAVVGAVAVTAALRWRAVPVAALGMGGLLLAPLLVGAPHGPGTLIFLWVAVAACSAVVVAQRWDGLSLAIAGLAVPQWVGWTLAGGHAPLSTLAVLLAFGSLGALAAVGHDLRAGRRLRGLSAFLLGFNALVLAFVGWSAIDNGVGRTAAALWLAGLGLAHVAGGLAARRGHRPSAELRLLALALGAALADTALGLLAPGLAGVAVWSLVAVGFAALIRARGLRLGERELVTLGTGVHTGLALLRAIAEAPPSTVGSGAGTVGLLALAAVVASSFASARLADEGRPRLAALLDGIGLLTLAYLTAQALDGAVLAAAWAAEASALAVLARGTGDGRARLGALGFLALAVLHAVGVEAPASALRDGAPDLLAAGVALAAVTLAALRTAHAEDDVRVRRVLLAVAALAPVHLASVAIVGAFAGGPALDAGGLGLGAHQQGQVALSVFWALCGVGALLTGLRRDHHDLRLAGLAGLGVAAGKVFLVDLATLTSIYRVASFVVLGLLLLGAGLAWERTRSRERVAG